MKLANLLFSAFALCLASTAPTTTAHAEEDDTQYRACNRIDRWIVDLLTDGLSDGGWNCQCTPKSSNYEVQGLFPADEVEPKDGHTYTIGNFSDSEIRVSLRMVEDGTAIELGKTELVIGPNSSRQTHLDFYIPEGRRYRHVETYATVSIPEDANTSRADEHMVIIYRVHNSQRENVGDFRIDQVLCSKQRCLRTQDDGIGGCRGPGFHDCL